MAKKQKEKSSKNIFSLGPIPKGIDSTLAFPSTLKTAKSRRSKKRSNNDFKEFEVKF